MLFLIYLSPVAYHNNSYNNLLIFNFTDDAIVPNAITPELLQVPCPGFTVCSRIRGYQNSFFKILLDAPLDRGIKLQELFLSILLKPQLPFSACHSLSQGELRSLLGNKSSHLVGLFHSERALANNLLDLAETLPKHTLHNSFLSGAFLWKADQDVFLTLQAIGQQA